MVNEYEWIYVLFINTVNALVDNIISSKRIHYVAINHLLGIIGGCDDGFACQPLMVLSLSMQQHEEVEKICLMLAEDYRRDSS